MNKVKVSILVPIYNVEKYLPHCLDSVVSQTLQDIEIICLNDGSTDSSLEIIKDFAAKDPRIKIIDKENSGYGDSMNQGLDLAKGEYIGIVESDDWIEPEMFEQLYHLAKKRNAEVARSNYFHYLKGINTKHYAINPAQVGRLIDPHQPGENHIFYQAPAIWSAIYNRNFLNQNGIRFLPTPGAAYQDTGFNFKVWACAHKAIFTNNAYLHYRLDNESSSVNSPGKVYNVNKEYAEIERFLKEKNLLAELSGIMEVAKFGAFYWNFHRLPYKFAKPFLLKFREEIHLADQKNLINWDMFNQRNQKVLELILERPPIILFVLDRIRSFPKEKLRPFFSHLHEKLHPSYHKQRLILEELNKQKELTTILQDQIKISTRKVHHE